MIIYYNWILNPLLNGIDIYFQNENGEPYSEKVLDEILYLNELDKLKKGHYYCCEKDYPLDDKEDFFEGIFEIINTNQKKRNYEETTFKLKENLIICKNNEPDFYYNYHVDANYLYLKIIPSYLFIFDEKKNTLIKNKKEETDTYDMEELLNKIQYKLLSTLSLSEKYKEINSDGFYCFNHSFENKKDINDFLNDLSDVFFLYNKDLDVFLSSNDSHSKISDLKLFKRKKITENYYEVTIVGDYNDADYSTTISRYDEDFLEIYLPMLYLLKYKYGENNQLEYFPFKEYIDLPYSDYDICHSLEKINIMEYKKEGIFQIEFEKITEEELNDLEEYLENKYM